MNKSIKNLDVNYKEKENIDNLDEKEKQPQQLLYLDT